MPSRAHKRRVTVRNRKSLWTVRRQLGLPDLQIIKAFRAID